MNEVIDAVLVPLYFATQVQVLYNIAAILYMYHNFALTL